MDCKIVLLVKTHNSETGKEEVKLLPLISGIDENTEISYRDLAERIAKMPKEVRKSLATEITRAKQLKLTSSDFKKNRFISNITLSELTDKYTYLKEAYPDVISNIDENFTLIYCNQFKLSGKNYTGRLIDANGKEIFVITNKYDAENFIRYLDAKNKVKQVIKDGVLMEEYKEYLKDLDRIASKFKISPEEVINEFLNNKKKFKSFKDDEGLVNPRSILNRLVFSITKSYIDDPNKSILAIDFDNIASKVANNKGLYKVNLNKLYKLVSDYDAEMSEETFKKMSAEELTKYLRDLFYEDLRLMRISVRKINVVESTSNVTKDKRISLPDLKEIWKKIQSNYAEKGITYKGLDSSVKKSHLDVIDRFKEYFSENPEEVAKYTNGKFVYNFLNDVGKIEISYKPIPKEQTSKEVIFEYPWTDLGSLFGFGYNSEYLFTPLKKEEVPELDKDGMYLGVYISEYYNPKTETTNYAISRHIISPHSYAATFTSLEDAKRKIEEWNATLTLEEYGMYTIKLDNLDEEIPNSAIVESGNLSDGSLITTLNIKIPSITLRKLPESLKRLMKNNLSTFYKYFEEFFNKNDLKLLNTPEKAATFLFKIYGLIKSEEDLKEEAFYKKYPKDKFPEKKYERKDITESFKKHKKQASEIIKEIDNATTKSYYIRYRTEDKISHKTIAYLSYLKNNGNELDTSGKMGDEELHTLNILGMEQAAYYIENKYGVKVTIHSLSELEEYDEKNKLELGDKLKSIRGFVHNGEIHINGSNADMSDLYHEMAHIILGVLKIKYGKKDYPNFIATFLQDPNYLKYKNTVDVIYKNFSEPDRIEETIVSIIADRIFNKNSYSERFNKDPFNQEILNLLKMFPRIASDLKSENSLGFKSYTLKIIKENKNKLITNMLISQLIDLNIRLGLIKEDCE